MNLMAAVAMAEHSEPSAGESGMDNHRIRQRVRAWMTRRRDHPEPLPSLEQIRRAVGWAEGDPAHDANAAPAVAMAAMPAR